MPGDYSRFRFKSRDDYSGVLMQQGRVLLDADWNELVELLDRRLRAETIDIIGRCVVPREPRDPDGVPSSFRIVATPGNLAIGRGRAYVDGLLAENHGNPPLGFNSALAEQEGTTAIPYAGQPYLPGAPALPGTAGPHLVYLDVWQREVTPTQAPNLIEQAVGVDTTTRLQTVWQVKVLPNVGAGVSCDTPGDLIPGWLAATRRSAGLLTTGAVPGPVSADPCIIAESGGYRGIENRLYRVEIHNPGVPGTATFKWSRDDASIATTVTAINVARDQLTVSRIGRDAVLRFANGDWIEVTDDRHELNGQPGIMRRIAADPDEVNLTLALNQALPNEFDATDPTRHTRIILWNQKGIVRDSLGNPLTNLDLPGSTGVINVPPAATSVILEDGVQITFGIDPTVSANVAERQFHTADYWGFAARTGDGSVEALVNAPPRGIHHHFCRLAIVTFPDRVIDCRTFWPPEFPHDGESCDCAACVTVESHESGTLTLQQAVNQVKGVGGKICVGPGVFILNAPLLIDDALSLQIVGVGLRTILIYQGRDEDAAVQIRTSLDVTLSKMVVASDIPGINVEIAAGIKLHDLVVWGMGSGRNALGIGLTHYLGVDIERCIVAQSSGILSRGTGAAIGLAGVAICTAIRDSVLIGSIGVASATTPFSPGTRLPGFARDTTRYLITAGLEISDNLMLTSRRGIGLDNIAIHLGATSFARNSINGCAEAGILATGAVFSDQLPGSYLDIEDNAIRTTDDGNGIVISTDNTCIAGNDITALTMTRRTVDPDEVFNLGGNGIVLAPFLLAAVMFDAAPAKRRTVSRCQILANRITRLSGYGIYFAPTTFVGSVMIKQNIIEELGLGGIVMEHGFAGLQGFKRDVVTFGDGDFVGALDSVIASAADIVVVENNQLLNIAPTSNSPEVALTGVRLFRTNKADIIGNIITRLGLSAAQNRLRCGIEAYNCGAVLISNNHVSGVGPVSFLDAAAGVLVTSCRRADISGNMVERLGGVDANKAAEWYALIVTGAPSLARLAASPGSGGAPAGRGAVAAPNERILLPRGLDSVSVRGNVLDAIGSFPAAVVDIDGTCIFTDNQCFLNSVRPIPTVTILSGAAIVSNNYVEGLRDSSAITIDLPAAGSDTFTVLGNIASGIINVNGAGLPAPWASLNRRAP